MTCVDDIRVRGQTKKIFFTIKNSHFRLTLLDFVLEMTVGRGNPTSRKACRDGLAETDVIFGTRGNGRNTPFIRTLEERANLYTRLSKVEKMEFIRDLIIGWVGRFFILGPDGNISVVRDSSPSSKLYISVRRMMNYVVKKTGGEGPRQSFQHGRREVKKIGPIARRISFGECDAATATVDRSTEAIKGIATGGNPDSSRMASANFPPPLVQLEEAAIATLAALSSVSGQHS